MLIQEVRFDVHKRKGDKDVGSSIETQEVDEGPRGKVPSTKKKWRSKGKG